MYAVRTSLLLLAACSEAAIPYCPALQMDGLKMARQAHAHHSAGGTMEYSFHYATVGRDRVQDHTHWHLYGFMQ